MHTGAGGNGCVSFLREKFIEDGPPNGGNGGTGGNVFIQAVEGYTSLHKLARRRVIRAGRGITGKGKSKGGQRGEDVVITVPVGTVIREVGRYDPVAQAEQHLSLFIGEVGVAEARRSVSAHRDRWVLYPGSMPSDLFTTEFPELPLPRRSALAAAAPRAPIYLDLSHHMETPMLLAAGGVGGLGNPNFASRLNPRPMFASRGEGGIRLDLELELKMLADVGLVGLPNAGKSTLLRSITNSRTRIGSWAFTTLSPSIGTVVLDNQTGRPLIESRRGNCRRTNFTIADIPGLIEGAHQDYGLGLGFLRHVERARILAFVIDLHAGDAVESLKGLWRELKEYQRLRERHLNIQTESRTIQWHPIDSYPTDEEGFDVGETLPPPELSPYPSSLLLDDSFPPMYAKPWLVIGTKADLEGTQENFISLRHYLSDVEKGLTEHPCGDENGWRNNLHSIPVSAINAEGVEAIPRKIVHLLDNYR